MPISSLQSNPRVGLCTEHGPVPLEHVEVRAEIRGACARVTCTQRYRNTETQPIEAVYVFPVDERAAVCGFAAVVAGIRYEGVVRSRDQAFAAYDDAIAEGHGAFLLDEEQPDVFTASIGNMTPDSTAQITLTYVVELAYEGESVRFTLPTTVSPRYAPAQDRTAIGRSPAEALNPPRASDVPYGLTFSATIVGTGRIRRVESPSHPLAVEFDGDRATAMLSQQSTALDRDLVLLLTGDEIRPHVVLERHPKGRVTAAITLRPTFTSTHTPSDVIFLVDRSGSMQGSSIEQVRNALQLCLRSLDKGCTFNIIGFGSTYESLFKECRQYDESSLAEASRHIASLAANLGGTEMLSALEFALERAAGRERTTQLVVMTDGQVTNTDAVIEAVRRRAGRVRVFTFGIGRGASHFLVRGLARAGDGAAEFVYPGERLEPKVMRQFRRVLSPAVREVRLDIRSLRATSALRVIPPVYADDPLRLYLWIDELTAGTVSLHARGPEGPLSWSIDIRPSEVIDGAMVGTLAARARIREIEEGETWAAERGSRQRDRQPSQAVSEVVRLAMEYGLASRETSWVAIEKRDVPVTDEAVLKRVPIAITSGWSQSQENAFVPSIRPILASRTFGLPLHGGWSGGPDDTTALVDDALEHVPTPRVSADRSRFGWFGRWMSRRSESPLATTESSTRALDRLIALQHADGYWDLDEPLAVILGVSLQDLVDQLAGTSGEAQEVRRAWATALALTFLERQASSNRTEWEMLAAKATRWLDGAAVVPPDGTSWLEWAGAHLNAEYS
jgi:Vault protein inter-alpha-trypsin domain/von Willebrand factor type A domain